MQKYVTGGGESASLHKPTPLEVFKKPKKPTPNPRLKSSSSKIPKSKRVFHFHILLLILLVFCGFLSFPIVKVGVRFKTGIIGTDKRGTTKSPFLLEAAEIEL